MFPEDQLINPQPDLLPIRLAASSAIALGLGLFSWWILRSLSTEDLEQDSEWRFDVNRVNELRRIDDIFRNFQPIIQIFARINRNMFSDSLPMIEREIQAAGLPRFWMPEEYLGKLQFIALLITPFYLWFFVSYFGDVGFILGIFGFVITAWFFRIRLRSRALYRVVLIKRRLPFLLDLMTLLMEAGSTFLHSLGQGVREFHGHPVATEFGRVLSDMQMGKTRTDAFASMQSRLDDDEISGIISSIIQGEQLGSPLAQVFRIQSDVLRIKRTQRGEKIAAEAGVNMLLPGVLVMLSTVLIILGPFAINVISSGFFN
ncbi:MAG: type II secretion system F family protein [Planctomycetota bacterium]|nr:type II secretion system F family protein [Planctomycetota bacterium]